MSKETKPEMTVEEFTERWCLKVIECMKGDDYIIHDKEECRADLNSVIRGELIKYNRCLGKIIGHPTDETENIALVDRFLNNKQ